MKKIIWLLTVIALAFMACQKAHQVIPADPWANYRKAYELLKINRDSAFLYFNRLAENTSDKQQIALAYYNMALIQSDAGDHYGAQESLTLSLKSLDEANQLDHNYLATDFNELGVACFNLQEYTKAVNYYQQALHFTNDKSLTQYILNNRGNAYQKLGNYELALNSYRQVLNTADKNGTIYARALTNLATTEWLRNPRYNAAPELLRALKIRKRENDPWGENSSYAHLSDFYSKTQPDSALWYAQKMFAVAHKIESPDDKLEAIQKLILFSPPAKIKSYYLQYQALSDSLSFVRKAAKNQFALIRYGVEKNKAENFKLQKANTERKYQLGFVILLVLIGIPSMIIWYRKRKQRLQLEADNRIRQDRLQISQKVHDVVANGIYRVMNEVEYEKKLNRAQLLDQLETMYEQSRDITYNKEEALPDDFVQHIAKLLNAFKNKTIKLAVTGNDPVVWDAVNTRIKRELQPVLQELMVNMTKHSGASSARLSFEVSGKILSVAYRDNGVGISPDVQFGNGLRNTGNRIEGLGGKLNFVTDTGIGVRITFTIPIT